LGVFISVSNAIFGAIVKAGERGFVHVREGTSAPCAMIGNTEPIVIHAGRDTSANCAAKGSRGIVAECGDPFASPRTGPLTEIGLGARVFIAKVKLTNAKCKMLLG
jgi:hypothetical protein